MQINPTKLTVGNLLGSPNEQYVIPPYQRRYSWREPQIADLFDDIEQLADGDSHLLGSIVCLTQPLKAGVNTLELVDGQQRLTSIAIFMYCLMERFNAENETSSVQELERLLQARDHTGKTQPKVLLDSLDRDEFKTLISGENPDGLKNASLVTAFRLLREWVADVPIEKLRAIAYRLQHQAVIIRLDVSEAKDAFKLFETINHRGLRLSPTDIIKNFLLGNAARFGEGQLEAAKKEWAKLLECLDGVSSDTFFRYYLSARLRRRVTVSYVVSSFKELFMEEVREAEALPDRHLFVEVPEEVAAEEEEETPLDESRRPAKAGTRKREKRATVSFKQFLTSLVASARAYAELVLARTGNSHFDRSLRSLRRIRAHQSYGFLMYLRVGGCSDKDFRRVLELTETLMLRRQICRERANENDTLFGNLCGVDPKSPIKGVTEAYRDSCPADDKFEVEFATTSYNANLIDRARYCLERIELHLHGKHSELDVMGPEQVHVEHIIPQKIKSKQAVQHWGDWSTYLGPKAESLHPRYVGRIGNLTLFAGELNIGASNNPFHRKRDAYKKSSLRLTKDLAQMPHFRFDTVEKRSRSLAKLALELWPIP